GGGRPPRCWMVWAWRVVLLTSRAPAKGNDLIPPVPDDRSLFMAVPHSDYSLSQLEVLEAESIHIMREVAAEFERPILLFSGGKDSIVMLALAERAFWPARIPFPVMHVDTGHNFAEVIEFRDRRVEEAGARLVVASVQLSIDTGRVTEETGRWASR